MIRLDNGVDGDLSDGGEGHALDAGYGQDGDGVVDEDLEDYQPVRGVSEGLQHSVLVKVPIALMDKAGEYRFVISAKDSHADREKGHRAKWALERNSITN